MSRKLGSPCAGNHLFEKFWPSSQPSRIGPHHLPGIVMMDLSKFPGPRYIDAAALQSVGPPPGLEVAPRMLGAGVQQLKHVRIFIEWFLNRSILM
jgi:hypothetical protein